MCVYPNRQLARLLICNLENQEESLSLTITRCISRTEKINRFYRANLTTMRSATKSLGADGEQRKGGVTGGSKIRRKALTCRTAAMGPVHGCRNRGLCKFIHLSRGRNHHEIFKTKLTSKCSSV